MYSHETAGFQKCQKITKKGFTRRRNVTFTVPRTKAATFFVHAESPQGHFANIYWENPKIKSVVEGKILLLISI